MEEQTKLLIFETNDETNEDSNDLSEDEDVSIIVGFDEDDARARMKSFSHVTKITISTDLQKLMGILPGENLTDEHPWRAIKKDILEKHLSPIAELGSKLLEGLLELEPGSSVIIEFSPELSIDQDVFLVYTDIAEINEASEIIRRLELLERLKLKRVVEKSAKTRWAGECSGHEFELSAFASEEELAHDAEVQSVFPIRRAEARLGMRLVADARDGYVQLLPRKWKNINFPRKLTDRGIQARPQSCSISLQTDPTFPVNASTQYALDLSHIQVDPGLISQTKLHQVTDAVMQESCFNLIGLYQNEYDRTFPEAIQPYHSPEIVEKLSFMSRSVTTGRYVRSIDWHPVLSGIFVASYTFETATEDQAPKDRATASEGDRTTTSDPVNRAVFEKCPVLMWSFTDALVPLLELKSIREVTTVSFCPYDGDLLVGGLTNGQIALWDLKGEIARVEAARTSSSEHREGILQLLEQPAEHEIDRSVTPAAVSSLEHSPRGAISAIKWLPRNYFCTATAHLKVTQEKQHRFLMTSSLDGSVCFWDLNFSSPALQKMIAAATAKSSQMVDQTIYQRVDNLFFPVFKIICQTSIVCMVADEAIYHSTPLETTADLIKRVTHALEMIPVECTKRVILGTHTGQIVEGLWEGYEFDQGVLVNDETLQVTHNYSAVHDGPIVALERNPTVHHMLLSIGGHVLSLWSIEYPCAPIFWRQKPSKVTACQWSLVRVSVFFVGYADGNFEVWDLNMRTFRACICVNLGSESLTVISQHRLASARRCLAVADQNANIRIFTLSEGLVKAAPNEEQTIRDVIQHEISRRSAQSEWVKAYNDRNPIKAPTQHESTANENASLPEAMATQKSDNHKREVKVGQDKRMTLGDRLEQQYRAKHFQDLLGKLMERRNVSPKQMAQQMRPLVKRQQYNAEKRSAIATTLARAEGDYVNQKKILYPSKKAVTQGKDESRDRIKQLMPNIADYGTVEGEARETLRSHYLPQLESFLDVLVKGKDQRTKVCVDVGANMRHVVRYENKRRLRRLGVAPATRLEDLVPKAEDEVQTEVEDMEEVKDLE
ncbi:dynein axonemal intermediate chain 3-like [Anopheles cruzii]|uniref:dynein axonemal intermediate chain 3-like n=1 Tax=Anopheles cruzii TaxID=68878 RepID=UPI0022EC237B|nr:dynein axonemal intermediate chain 3-like [Anopheles cruzii]